MIEITLPWPDSRLLPNARVERYTHAEIVKKHRFIAKIETMTQRGGDGTLPEGDLSIEWLFYPPDRRHRDYDGMISAGKAYQDGIFDALGLNDHKIKRATAEIRETVKDGRYIVRISALQGDIIHQVDNLTYIE